MREAAPHYNAKMRMYKLVMSTTPRPDAVEFEYPYKNPFNRDGDPKWDWKFDVYFCLDNRKVAIEIDDKIGHSSKRSFEKRQVKREFLKSVGIELFGFPRKWIVGKRAFRDDVFLEELHLRKVEDIVWYSKKTFQ